MTDIKDPGYWKPGVDSGEPVKPLRALIRKHCPRRMSVTDLDLVLENYDGLPKPIIRLVETKWGNGRFGPGQRKPFKLMDQMLQFASHHPDSPYQGQYGGFYLARAEDREWTTGIKVMRLFGGTGNAQYVPMTQAQFMNWVRYPWLWFGFLMQAGYLKPPPTD